MSRALLLLWRASVSLVCITSLLPLRSYPKFCTRRSRRAELMD